MKYGSFMEYDLMRKELSSVKNCVTTYVGFAIGGSGAVLFGMARASSTIESYFFVATASIGMSLIISLVMSILFYKFTSHNRATGYCKLLNHEMLSHKEDDDNNYYNLHSWEVCIDKLRESDEDKNKLTGLVEKIDFTGFDKSVLRSKLDIYTGKIPSIDEGKYRKGLKLFFGVLDGNITTTSWVIIHTPMQQQAIRVPANQPARQR